MLNEAIRHHEEDPEGDGSDGSDGSGNDSQASEEPGASGENQDDDQDESGGGGDGSSGAERPPDYPTAAEIAGTGDLLRRRVEAITSVDPEARRALALQELLGSPESVERIMQRIVLVTAIRQTEEGDGEASGGRGGGDGDGGDDGGGDTGGDNNSEGNSDDDGEVPCRPS